MGKEATNPWREDSNPGQDATPEWDLTPEIATSTPKNETSILGWDPTPKMESSTPKRETSTPGRGPTPRNGMDDGFNKARMTKDGVSE